MANPAVGTQTIFSTGVESAGAYGTPVTPSRSYEFLSETLKRQNRILQSNGLRGGARHLRLGSRRALTGRAAAGDVTHEVATNGFGRLLNQALGGTSTVVQQGATAAYLQTHTLGSVAGKSQTLQKVLKDPDGTTIKTLTYPGSKVMAAEFSIAVDGILQLKLTYDCRDERDDIAAASAAYVANTRLFTFAQAALSLNGSAVANVLDATVTLSNPQSVDRRYLGNGGLKAEPIDSDFPTVTGQMRAELLDSTLYSLFVTDGGGALVLTFDGAVIEGAYDEKLVITVADVHITGESPAVAGPGVVDQPITWEAAQTAGGANVTITYQSSDTTI
jgi:hypothetical protein